MFAGKTRTLTLSSRPSISQKFRMRNCGKKLENPFLKNHFFPETPTSVMTKTGIVDDSNIQIFSFLLLWGPAMPICFRPVSDYALPGYLNSWINKGKSCFAIKKNFCGAIPFNPGGYESGPRNFFLPFEKFRSISFKPASTALLRYVPQFVNKPIIKYTFFMFDPFSVSRRTKWKQGRLFASHWSLSFMVFILSGSMFF